MDRMNWPSEMEGTDLQFSVGYYFWSRFGSLCISKERRFAATVRKAVCSPSTVFDPSYLTYTVIKTPIGEI